MTIKELILELKKCPDENAIVEYKNMEIDTTCSIGKVIIRENKYAIPQYRYIVVLD
jgi:hypothetical protein